MDLFDDYSKGMGYHLDWKWASEQVWMWADIGHTSALTGYGWPWCPAWFSRFAPASLQRRAERAITAGYWAQRGCLEAVEELPLETRMVPLVELVIRAIERDKAERENPKLKAG